MSWHFFYEISWHFPSLAICMSSGAPLGGSVRFFYLALSRNFGNHVITDPLYTAMVDVVVIMANIEINRLQTVCFSSQIWTHNSVSNWHCSHCSPAMHEWKSRSRWLTALHLTRWLAGCCRLNIWELLVAARAEWISIKTLFTKLGDCSWLGSSASSY